MIGGRDQIIDILDILHVSQYAWRAAAVFHSAFEDREAFVRERLLRILQGDARGVITGLRRMATQHGLAGQKLREITIVSGYFENNIHRMRYDEYLREGYPIATGVIEGACRHLVKDRMERSGMRWRLDGAQPMLNVRAVWQSSYWDTFQTYRIKDEQARLHPNRALITDYDSGLEGSPEVAPVSVVSARITWVLATPDCPSVAVVATCTEREA